MSVFKLAYTGDLVLQETSDLDPDFNELIIALRKQNAKLIVNLENPVVQPGMEKKKDKICLHCTEQEITKLKELNPYLVNLANNHINDYGEKSIASTQSALDNINLNYWGIGNKKKDQKHIHIDPSNKIINIAYVDKTSDLTGSLLWGDNENIGGFPPNLEEIKRLSKEYQNYSIIVNIHWGIEDIKHPEPKKIELAHQIIDNGADLIIGHHPHIIQPLESYKGKMIFYSLGNFYFPDITFEDNGIFKAKKAQAHQRKSIVPVFSFKKKAPSITHLFQINRRKDGKGMDVKEIQVSSICKHLKASEKEWDLYYKNLLLKRRINYHLRNPKTILQGIRKRIKSHSNK